MPYSDVRARVYWLAAAWLIPAVVLGIPYLRAPYSDLEKTGVVFGPGLLVLAIFALLACAFGRTPVLSAAAATTGALVTIVVFRVAMDVVVDPTDHNLWPFEIAIALVLGGVASLAGASLGRLGLRLLGRT